MRLAFLVLLLTTSLFAAGQQAVQAEDISGMYTFLREGEFVQITAQPGGRVTGFVSRYVDEEKDAFLDHFFKTGALEGDQLSFTTRTVHGVWFEFGGTVRRDPQRTRDEEGYFVIRGKLTRHRSDAEGKETAEQREVEFKSFPREEEPE